MVIPIISSIKTGWMKLNDKTTPDITDQWILISIYLQLWGFYTSINQRSIWHPMCSSWSGKCILLSPISKKDKKIQKITAGHFTLFSRAIQVFLLFVMWSTGLLSSNPRVGKLQPMGQSGLNFYAYELKMVLHFKKTSQ